MNRRACLAAALLLSCMLGEGVAKELRPFRGDVVAVWDNVFLGVTPQGASFTGTSQLTHFGRNTQTGTLFLTPVAPPALFNGTGSVTITAANGDTATFDYVGQLNAATGEGVGTFQFTSGTGRFRKVTGGGTFSALIDTSAATNQRMTVRLSGQIGY